MQRVEAAQKVIDYSHLRSPTVNSCKIQVKCTQSIQKAYPKESGASAGC